jgi:hypothetical protein
MLSEAGSGRLQSLRDCVCVCVFVCEREREVRVSACAPMYRWNDTTRQRGYRIDDGSNRSAANLTTKKNRLARS